MIKAIIVTIGIIFTIISKTLIYELIGMAIIIIPLIIPKRKKRFTKIK